MKKSIQKLVFTLVAIFLTDSHVNAQCYDRAGGTTSGVFTSDANLTGELFYTDFFIGSGVTITATGNAPLIIHASGNVTMNGTLTANGNGFQGGAGGNGGGSSGNTGGHGGGPGGGRGGCGGGLQQNGGDPGGHAAYKNPGSGGCSSAPAAYGSVDVLGLPLGSGGGGQGGGAFGVNGVDGGNGGGAIAIISCGVITINGSVTANGENAGAGGAGSGGTIYLSSSQNSVVLNGPIEVNGGTSASPGRIRIDGSTTGSVSLAGIYNPLYFTNTVSGLTDTEPSCYLDDDGSATVNLVQAGTGYTYLWNTGATTQTASGLSAGPYSVTVTNTNGCTKDLDAVLGQPDPITANMNATSNSATCNPIGGTPPYTYQWIHGPTSQTATNLTEGEYSVVVTDANGCTGIVAVWISGPSGIIDENTDVQIILSPNPASDFITISNSDISFNSKDYCRLPIFRTG